MKQSELVTTTRGPSSHLDRLDPVHELEWYESNQVQFNSASLSREIPVISPSGFLSLETRSYETDIDIAPADKYSPKAIRIMATLSQISPLTTLQLHALIGGEMQHLWSPLRSLHSAGLIQKGDLPESVSVGDRPYGGTGPLWRFSYKSKHLERWLEGLTGVEHLLLTNGLELSAHGGSAISSSAIRHNLIGAEILITALESSPNLVGFWGEPMNSAETFLGEDVVKEHKIRNNIADGALVTNTGKIILFEFSGSQSVDSSGAGAKLSSKAEGWANVVARSKLDLNVVFVDISPSLKTERFRYMIKRGIENSHRHMTRDKQRQRAHSRIFTADAADWFPLAGAVTKDLAALRCFAPALKEYVELAPNAALDSSNDAVINTVAALHTPPWVVGA